MLDTLITFDQLPQTMPVDVLEEAVALVDSSIASTDAQSVSKAISRLKGETILRNGDEIDFKLRLAALIDRLKPYPADLITSVCMSWADSNKFFPAWAEIKPLLDAKMRFRYQARQVLGDCLARSRKELTHAS